MPKLPNPLLWIPFACASALAAGVKAATFPSTQWQPVLRAGVPVGDSPNDGSGPFNLVGDAAFPSLYVSADSLHFFVRLRLGSDPRVSAQELRSGFWGFLIDVDGDLSSYEFLVGGDGFIVPTRLAIWENSTPTGGGP